MPDDLVFRRRVEPEEETTKPEPRETPNLIEGKADGALKDVDAPEEVRRDSPLDQWETEHGKYGHEYFGIQEIAQEFPLVAYFGEIDKFVRATIRQEGHTLTPEWWQLTINAIEQEIGSTKLDAYERLKKIAAYVRIVKRVTTLKDRQNSFKK